MAYSGASSASALVADMGSFSFRLGFAGDDLPRCYRPSFVGTVPMTADSSQRNHYFELSQPREDMRVDSIGDSRTGLVSDWELMERLMGYAQMHYLKNDFADSPIIIAEKPYNSPRLRHELAEIMFEKLRVPGLFLSKDAVLCCYACGKTSGVVVDIGAAGTVVTPVLDGWAEARAAVRSPVGGRYLDNYLYSIVKRRKGCAPAPCYKLSRALDPVHGLVIQPRHLTGVHSTYEHLMNMELARDLKETVCRMADSTLSEAGARYSSIPTAPYELPDGTIIDMGIDRFKVPELLCVPVDQTPHDEAEHKEYTGLLPPMSNESIPKIVLEAVQKSDSDNQGTLFGNVVVAGGGSCFEGLPERFKLEIERLVHHKVRVMAPGAAERGICAWLGGSILGSLGAFHEMWFTKAEYGEYGAMLVDRKCP